MTGAPAVSVFMPTYRRGDSGYLATALESVLAQRFRDFELLVADDGSTDSTAQVLAEFAARDERIRCVRFERNSGLPALRTAQLAPLATGRYYAFMFDDDIWYPKALAALVKALESHPTWDMTYGNALWPHLRKDGTVARQHVLGHEPREFDAARLRASNYISHLSVLLRREVFDRVGLCDPHILVRRLCDWDLWLRIASAGTIGHTDVLVGESRGRTTSDSLGRTSSMDLELTKLYMSLDRNELLLPKNVLAYPVDGLEVFGECASPALTRRASEQFAAFYRQIGEHERAAEWEQRAGTHRPERQRVAAVAVLYRPCPDEVLANIDSYRDQVDTVIAVDNTECPDRQFVLELESRGVAYVPLGENRGLGAALNEGCRRARELGFEWAVTFDQDSAATPGMVTRLFACVELEDCPSQEPSTGNDGRSRLVPLRRPIAMVAPTWQHVGGPPETTTGGSVELETAMTSGCLTRLSVLEELGGFREDLFIDLVDHEFCLRARRHGRRIMQQRDAVLLHEVGHLRRVTFPLRCWVTDHSPVRRYYMVRNLLELGRDYECEFPESMARERRRWYRQFVKVMLAEPQRLQKARMMLRGWHDYRRGRFGRYEDLHP